MPTLGAAAPRTRPEARTEVHTETPFVTVVMPVRNEARHLAASLGAVLAQDWPAERFEILVVDGRSTDGTAALARDIAAHAAAHVQVRVLDNPAHHAAAALNIGLRAARGDVIVRVDGHAEIAPDFVRRSVAALLSSGADAAGGPIVTRAPDDAGPTARALAVAMSTAFGAGNAAFRTGAGDPPNDARDVDTVAFAAYRRAALERLGGFDERFPRNQDDELHLRLVRAGGRIRLDPSIRTTYRCRRTLRAAARQYFGYGFHKARLLRLHGRLPSARGLAPLALVVGLLALAVLALALRDARWFAAAALPYLAASVIASGVAAARTGWAHLPFLPAAYAALHLGYGAGFLCGIPSALLTRNSHVMHSMHEGPGDAWLIADRAHRLRALLAHEGIATLGAGPHLDAGCGRGTSIATLRALGAAGLIFGVDRETARFGASDARDDRAALQASATPTVRATPRALSVGGLRPQCDTRTGTPLLAAADLASLPFRDGAFTSVLLATAATSIADSETRRRAAREVVRVLRPGAALLWYDLRLPGGSVAPVGARALRRLFPGCRVALHSAGLVPPLARAVAHVSPRLCDLLALLPPLRSHLVAVVRRTEDLPPAFFARGDAARRALDLALAAPLALAAAPLVAVLALCVRLDSRGPALHRARRVGRGGYLFTMPKLRTMRIDAVGPALTSAGDPRITRVGAFLRRTHLDELPQLWSVLRGDLALVGPRPETPEFVDLGDPRWQRVLAARPGITGPSQLAIGPREARRLRGADAASVYRAHVLPRKLRVDMSYLARRSAVSDLGWIARTALRVVRPR